MSKLHDNPFRPDYDNGAPDAETPTTEDFQAAHIEALKNELTTLRAAHEAAQAEIAALKRGEYICQKCGLRKDGEHEKGDF